jgi:hypothetical protein
VQGAPGLVELLGGRLALFVGGEAELLDDAHQGADAVAHRRTRGRTVGKKPRYALVGLGSTRTSTCPGTWAGPHIPRRVVDHTSFQ